MNLDVRKQLAALPRLSVAELRRRYAEVFGEATHAAHKAWLIKRIAWRLQAQAEGDLSERARQRAHELANDADLRLSPPKVKRPEALPVLASRLPRVPLPGTILTRTYKGKLLQVAVRADGFEFEGAVYRSLSAVAKAVTGSHCSGNLFFGLTQRGGQR
jgi:Protein of unknown function (DUF2924)